MLGNAGINVAEIVLAKVDFESGDVGFGLLWAASGLGLLLGSLYAPRWLEVRGILLVYTGSLALMGFGALTAAISPTVWVACPAWCWAAPATARPSSTTRCSSSAARPTSFAAACSRDHEHELCWDWG